jgi:hypothetical protein
MTISLGNTYRPRDEKKGEETKKARKRERRELGPWR